MAQKKQKQKRLRAKTKISPADAAKLYKQESMKPFNALKGDVKRVLDKYSKADMERMKKFYGDIDRTKLAKFKKVPKKSLAKRLVGKTLAKAIPGAGTAIIVHDVMRAGAKKGCIKRGGKWVNGKCSGQVREGKKKYPGLTPYPDKE